MIIASEWLNQITPGIKVAVILDKKSIHAISIVETHLIRIDSKCYLWSAFNIYASLRLQLLSKIMAPQVHPWLISIYEANRTGDGASRFGELIQLISSRDDAEDFIEAMDQLIEDNLEGYWTDDGEVYCLDDETCFDGIDSAREYVKEQMNTAEWIDIILEAVSKEQKEKERCREDEIAYHKSVSDRLKNEDVIAMIGLMQNSYEEHSRDDDDYNPYLFEQSLFKKSKIDLVGLFIEYFLLPRHEDVVSQLINLEWMPDHLLDAFGLLEARDAVRTARLNSSRCDQLQKLLKQLGPISYPNCSDLEYLCNVVSRDLPRKRQVIDQIESLINGFN